MTVHHIYKPDNFLRAIVKETFPGYNGRSFKLSTNVPTRLNSYWDGGSRDYYSFYHLDTAKSSDVQNNHPFYDEGNPSDLELLPRRVLLVKRSIMRGKDRGITIYANKDDLAPMLPAQTELTREEKIVLEKTNSLKSSYGGIKNYRFSQSGLTIEKWNEAKASLIESKLLNRAGAITAHGKNAIQARW